MDRVNLRQIQKEATVSSLTDEERPTVRKVTRQLIGDVAHAVASLTILPADVGMPAWIGEEAPFPAGHALVADALRGYLAAKPVGEPIWPGNWILRAAAMIRIDSEAAREEWLSQFKNDHQRQQGAEGDFLAYRHADGLIADFHALRHTYITLVGKAGVSPKEHQDLAGHSTYALTARYTHSRFYDLAAAVQSLPIPKTERVVLAATGTDGPNTGLRPDRALTKTAGMSGNGREESVSKDTRMSQREDPGKRG